MSWKPEVICDSTGQSYGNALRFETREEALDNARDLMCRWMLVRDYRATECADPVNYRWTDKGLENVETV